MGVGGGADLVIDAMGLGHRTWKREALTQLGGAGGRSPRQIRRGPGLGGGFISRPPTGSKSTVPFSGESICRRSFWYLYHRWGTQESRGTISNNRILVTANDRARFVGCL